MNFADFSDYVAMKSAAKAGSKPEPRRHFTLTAFNDVMLSTTSNYLIRDVLPASGLTIMWGAPKSGKSFLAFDMSMYVSLGWVYRGHRVRQGAVVYAALEGGHGFRRRIVAWRMYHLAGHTDPVPF
jgi:hypothetical protein